VLGDGVLIVGRPGRAHAIWLFRSEARFAGWYVNLEDPWRPWRLGFDTEDHTIDLWVDRDGAWRWKDEDELEIAVDVGF
jgi:predicted RNA-binding protein associated with RNAse of E/G family